MLYAKISPSANFVQAVGPFSSPIEIQANYVTAVARPYALGTSVVDFQVSFGNVRLSDVGTPLEFIPINFNDVTVTINESSLSLWGIDDSVILEQIISELGAVEAVEFITINPIAITPLPVLDIPTVTTSEPLPDAPITPV
jgi:hypothetical protein